MDNSFNSNKLSNKNILINMNNIQRNSNDSLNLSQKSENNNFNDYKNEDIKNSLLKSITYNMNNDTSLNINYLNDNQNNNQIPLQKSRTSCENYNRSSFIIRLNNFGQNRLETVLETISEVSNSKVNSSSKIRDDNENNENSNKKIEENENEKIKEETLDNTEKKIPGSDIKIYDSTYNNNTTTKKSYFLSSDKN